MVYMVTAVAMVLFWVEWLITEWEVDGECRVDAVFAKDWPKQVRIDAILAKKGPGEEAVNGVVEPEVSVFSIFFSLASPIFDKQGTHL